VPFGFAARDALHWVVVRIGAAPFAGGFIEHVACAGVGASAGKDARRLFGQVLGRIDNFRFQRDIVTDVLAVLDLLDLPGSECHVSLLTTSIVYGMGGKNSSDTRHKSH
jgi:hypothetical protein